MGVTLKKFAVVCTGSIVFPGIVVEGDAIVAVGFVVTKNVNAEEVVAGNPAKVIADGSQIKLERQERSLILGGTHLKRVCLGKDLITTRG